MTLIAVAYDSNSHFLALSDTLISTTDSAFESAEGLPLQRGLRESGFVTGGIGLRRKAIARGPHLFLWADHWLASMSIVGHCLNQADLSPSTFRDHLQVFSAAELGKVQLIYCHFVDGRLSITSHNCDPPQTIGEVIVISAGSGTFDLFREDLPLRAKSSREGSDARAYMLRKFGEFVHREQSDETHAYFKYGGCYELAVLAPGGGFRKLPYTLTTFQHKKKRRIIPRRVYYSRYLGDAMRYYTTILHERREEQYRYTIPGALELSRSSVASEGIDGITFGGEVDQSGSELHLAYVHQRWGGFLWHTFDEMIYWRRMIDGQRVFYGRLPEYAEWERLVAKEWK